MLNCGKGNDCTYVRGNYSALSEAVYVGQHNENRHMVFKFTRYSYSIYSTFSLLFHLNISSSNLYKILTSKKSNLYLLVDSVEGQHFIQQEVRRRKTGL